MSVYVSSWVWQHSESAGCDRLVLLAIADEADDQGQNAYPSIPTIARKARVDRATAIRSIARLEAAGEILVKRPATRGRGRHNRYVVLMGRDPRQFAEHMAPFERKTLQGATIPARPIDTSHRATISPDEAKTSHDATIPDTSQSATIRHDKQETSHHATIPEPETSRNGREKVAAGTPTQTQRKDLKTTTPSNPPPRRSSATAGGGDETHSHYKPEALRAALTRRGRDPADIDRALAELELRSAGGRPVTSPGNWCEALCQKYEEERQRTTPEETPRAATTIQAQGCGHLHPEPGCTDCDDRAAALQSQLAFIRLARRRLEATANPAAKEEHQPVDREAPASDAPDAVAT